MATEGSPEDIIRRLEKENEELQAKLEDYKNRVAAAEALIAELIGKKGLETDVETLKRIGQARDLERQRNGTITVAELEAGMKALVKKVKRVED